MEAKARTRGRRGPQDQALRDHGAARPDRLTSGVWARALEHEDELAGELIERAVKALGAGVASAVNVLDVEAVIFGGGLGLRLGEPYVEKIDEADVQAPVRRRAPPADHLAELGDLGGAIGATLLFDK